MSLIKSISRVIRRANQDTVVIPGHGDLANRRQLVQYRRMLRDVKKNVEKHKDMGLDVESVKDLNLTEKYDHKWGQGDLITGRQFVGFVYNTLEDKAEHFHRQASSNPDNSSAHKHASNDSHETPWELSFDASNIETRLNSKGRVVFLFKEENATLSNDINNNSQQHLGQLSIKQLAKNFDELTGNSFAESTLTYSQKDRQILLI